MIPFKNYLLENSRINNLPFNVEFTYGYTGNTYVTDTTIVVNTQDVLNYIYNNNTDFKKFGEYAKKTQTVNQGFYIKDSNYGFIRSAINYIDTGINLNRALNQRKLNDDFKRYIINDKKASKFLDIFEDNEGDKISIKDILDIASRFFLDTMDYAKSWASVVESNLEKERISTDVVKNFFQDNGFEFLPVTQLEDFNGGIDCKVKKEKEIKTVQIKYLRSFNKNKASSWSYLYGKKGLNYLTIYTEIPNAIHFFNLKNNKYKIISI